ncbi:MAG TPA: SUMF1/EgtB/PvdO family nonheme iron enzyme [Xanthobacteraceae bacterium]|nr:SUMF1/EgtB/PvdO family nonheme iron enzyme [Xanthobacteraceae bacterium]
MRFAKRKLFGVLALIAALAADEAHGDAAADCKSKKYLLAFLRIEACNAVINADPNDADARVRRGDAYHLAAGSDDRFDNDDRAIADYTEALRLNPGREDALLGRAQAYGDRRAYAAAIADYDAVLRRKPDLALAHYRRGVLLSNLKRYDRAIRDLDAAVRLDADLVEALHLIGDAYRVMGDYPRAIAEYTEQFRRADPRGQDLKDRAIAYLRAGDYAHAIADFDAAALDNAPFSAFTATGLYGRGIARVRKGDPGGRADIAAALARDQDIARKLAHDGLAFTAAEGGPAAAPSEPDLTLSVLSPARARALGPGDSFRECARCPQMVVVPAGSFVMGSSATEPGREDSEGPQHRVTIARPFAVAKLAVTSEEWQACVFARGCRDDADDGWGPHHAVTGPSWNDAQSYVTWLSKLTGKTYRLLSEAEYEYATRAGTQTAFPWGDTAGVGHADCAGCGIASSNTGPAPAGTFAANAFGLFDMVGNEQSFVEDCWHDSYDGAPTDGGAWTSDADCGTRVVRGGSWASAPAELRVGHRETSGTSDRYPIIGFRVARTLER